MSEKGKKTRAKPKKQEVVAESTKETKPTAKLPDATVSTRHEGEMIERPGKGFSISELSQASLPMRLALAWRVPTDLRRRSMIEGNVQSLREWYSPPVRKAAKPAPAPAPEPEEVPPEAKPAKKRAVRKKKAAK